LDFSSGQIEYESGKFQDLNTFLSNNNMDEDEFFTLYSKIRFVPDEGSLGESILEAREMVEKEDILVKIVPSAEGA